MGAPAADPWGALLILNLNPGERQFDESHISPRFVAQQLEEGCRERENFAESVPARDDSESDTT